jgi:hypothetical protein
VFNLESIEEIINIANEKLDFSTLLEQIAITRKKVHTTNFLLKIIGIFTY